jgi:hypothetical protein
VSTGISLGAAAINPALGLAALPVGAVAGTQAGYRVCNFLSGQQCKPPTPADYVESGLYSYLGRFLRPVRNLISPVSEALAAFLISFLTSLAREPHPVVRLFNCTSCKDLLEKILRYLRSMDPNDILGPAGYGDGHFIGVGDVLEYKIEFENEANATAPAQLVKIEYVLDPGLDMATIRLGTFAFGNFSTSVGFASNRYSEIVDVRETTETYVLLQAIPDAIGNKFIWIFQALDETGQQPTNATIGFLPPNNGTTGQGYVTFRINIKNDVTDSARINANATIWFDENPPISTRTIFNTVDRTPPGKVAINATQVPGGILIQFSSDEAGSGVRSFDLFDVSDPSLPPSVIKTDIQPSAALVNFINPGDGSVSIPNTGQNIIYLNLNQTYHLIAVAVDNVGNRGTFNLENVVEISYWSSTGAPSSLITCPLQCSGDGLCTVDGCVCNDGYTGVSCNQTASAACEPPVLELFVVSNFTRATGDLSSAAIFVSANAPSSASNVSIYVRIFIVPNVTYPNKGQRQQDGSWRLTLGELGDVTLTTPSQFIGFVNVTVSAVLMSQCGTSMRTQDINMYADQIADNTSYATSALTASMPGDTSYGSGITNLQTTTYDGLAEFNNSSTSVASVTGSNASEITGVSSTFSEMSHSFEISTFTQPLTASATEVLTVAASVDLITETTSMNPALSSQAPSTIANKATAAETKPINASSITETASANTDISFQTPPTITGEATVAATSVGTGQSTITGEATVAATSVMTGQSTITGEATAAATSVGIVKSTSIGIRDGETNLTSTNSLMSSTAAAQTHSSTLNKLTYLPTTPSQINNTETRRETSSYSILATSTTSLAIQWSQWSEWSTCSRTCDAGIQQRWRRCLLNEVCNGNSVDVATCLMTKCPGMWSALFSFFVMSQLQNDIRAFSPFRPQYMSLQLQIILRFSVNVVTKK